VPLSASLSHSRASLSASNGVSHQVLDFDGSYGLGVLTDGYFPMNAFIGGWVLLAIVAASMSTGDGAILAMSTVWSHNLCRKLPVRRAECRRVPSSARHGAMSDRYGALNDRYGARSARKECPRWPFKVPGSPAIALGWQVHHL
jgi:hypothetical protein